MFSKHIEFSTRTDHLSLLVLKCRSAKVLGSKESAPLKQGKLDADNEIRCRQISRLYDRPSIED